MGGPRVSDGGRMKVSRVERWPLSSPSPPPPPLGCVLVLRSQLSSPAVLGDVSLTRGRAEAQTDCEVGISPPVSAAVSRKQRV